MRIKDELERDYHKCEFQIEDLRKKQEMIRQILREYFPFSKVATMVEHAAPSEQVGRIDQLSISDACEIIFKDMGNPWLSLADLHIELKQRNKICSKGSIEIGLKAKPDLFEIVKRGRVNFYRLITGQGGVKLLSA